MVLNSGFALGGGDRVERSDECDCRRLVMGRGSSNVPGPRTRPGSTLWYLLKFKVFARCKFNVLKFRCGVVFRCFVARWISALIFI